MFRLLTAVLASVVLVNLFFVHQVPSALAADGIFKQVNFQGKLQNTDGTNVTDGNYTVVFTLYDASSAGNNLWDETQTVSTVDGIFRVSLGSVDTTLGNVNFNSDSIYLGIKVGTDAEMTPRIRFTAVPYALNAQKVNGLTVTNTSDNPFSSTTTLKIGDGKTVSIANGLSFSGTDGTSFVFPSTGGNIVTEDFTQTLTNKSIGSTGLTFSGATTDITTGTNEHFVIMPNGTGNVGIGSTSPGKLLDVAGDFRASGAITLSNFTGNNAVLFATTGTGVLSAATTSTSGQCLVSGASATYTPSWGSCGGGASAWSGLTDPSANLSLTMGTNITTFNWATGTSTNNLYSLTTDASANGTGSLLNIQTGASSTLSPLRVRAGSTEAIFVNSSGNVGIGTTSPASALEITRNDGVTLTIDGDANADTIGNAVISLSEGLNASTLTYDSGTGLSIATLSSSDDLMLGVNETTVMTIDGATTNIGIGTTTMTGAKLTIGDGGSAAGVDLAQIAPANGITTTGVDGLQIDYATAGTTASADNAGLRVNVTSNNSGATTTLEGIYIGDLTSAEANSTETALKIGTGWDVGISVASGGISISGGSLSYSGSARPTKTITLSPEYAGAVLTAYYGAGTDTNITGTMTSDTDTTQGTSIRNYYQWERTTDATQHYYTVAVRVTLPKDFSAWATSNALVVNYQTESATNTVSDLDVRVYNENSATIVASSTDNASTSWSTVSIDDSVLDDNTSSEWDAADETVVIYLRMGSASSNYVRIGDIQLNYLAGF